MPISVEEIDRKSWGTWVSYDIPNVDEVLPSQANWNERTLEDRQASNRLWDAHSIDSRPDDRSDPLLVQVVEELGEEANGAAANLRVVEIPDGTAFEISDYDGIESVHETHEVWG